MNNRTQYSIYVAIRLMMPKTRQSEKFTANFTLTPFYDGGVPTIAQTSYKDIVLRRNPKHDTKNLIAFDSEKIYLYHHKGGTIPQSIKQQEAGRTSKAYVTIHDHKKNTIAHLFPKWYYEHEQGITIYEYKTTAATNAQNPNHQVTVQLNTQTCPHTYDGAIKVAEYIVGEIKRNVKSPVVQNIRDWLAESARQRKDPTIWDRMNKAYGMHPDPFLQMALTAWAEKVGPKRDWDHKPKLYKDDRFNRNSGITVHRPPRPKEPETIFKSHYHKYKNYDYYFDIWSNIHYGYVGLSAGFDERTLIDGSNTQQILNYNTQGGDTIDDDTAIKIGFKLYEKFGKFAEKLTYQDVLDLLDKTDVSKIPNSKQVHWCYNEQNPNRIKR